MSQRYASYLHIVSDLFLRTTPRKYNTGGYTSGTDIAMNLRQFLLIAYICGFRKYMQMLEYTKYKWIDQKHHGVLQLPRILFVTTMN